MISIEQIIYIVPVLGLAASIVYYAQILRNTNKARQRELILQRYQGYTKEYISTFFQVRKYQDWKTPDDWRKKYGYNVNLEADTNWSYIMSIYNTAGLLLKEKEAEPELLFQLYPPHVIITIWEQFEPIIKNLRTMTHPTHLEPFEFLYNEAKKRYPEITPQIIPVSQEN